MTQTLQSGLKLLSFLIGTWQTKGEVNSTDNKPMIKFKGTDTYEWVLSGNFIQHKVDVMMGEEKTETIEMVGEFHEAKRTYEMRSFDNQGNYTKMKAYIDTSGNLQIVGDKMRSTLSIIDNKNMSATWERSEDNKTWLPWMNLRLSK
jgi:hypothetical protein